MIKIFRITKNILSLIGLFFLSKHAYDFYQASKLQPKATEKTQSSLKIAVSSRMTKLKKDSQITETNDANVQTEPVIKTISINKKDLEKLKNQAERAVGFLQKETVIPEHTQNNLMSRLKEVISHIDHLNKYLQKGPSVEAGADESAQENSKSIFEATVQRKGLALAHKLEKVLAELTNEMTGQTTDVKISTTVSQSIQLNNDLLNKLVL